MATGGTGDVLAGVIGALVAAAFAQDRGTDAASLAAIAALSPAPPAPITTTSCGRIWGRVGSAIGRTLPA